MPLSYSSSRGVEFVRTSTGLKGHMHGATTANRVSRRVLPHHRTRCGPAGHLFQGRLKGGLVQGESHLRLLTRYIHLNPVRAGIVGRPLGYNWSSYGVYVGKRKCPEWLDMEGTSERFGSESAEQRREYGRFVEEGLS